METGPPPWQALPLPTPTGPKWAVVDPYDVVTPLDTIDGVVQALAASSLPLLIARPGTSQYLAPSEVPEVARRLRDPIAKQSRLLGWLGSLAATAVFIVAMALQAPPLYLLSASFAAFGVGFLIDERGLRTDADLRGERTLFQHWLRRDPTSKRVAAATFFVLTSLWAGQWMLQTWLGGAYELWLQIGVLYPLIDGGEYWRFATGPFLHYSVIHAATNAAMLAALIPIAWRQGPLRAVWIAFICAVIGAYLQYKLGGRVFDNYGGLSGGAYGLASYIVATQLTGTRLLPKGLTAVLFFMFAASALGAEGASRTTATVAHAGGALAGVALALAEASANFARSRIARLETL